MSDLELLTLALGNAGEEAARSILGHVGSLDRFDALGSARNIVALKLSRVSWSTAVRCEVIFEMSLRILGATPAGAPEEGHPASWVVDSGLLQGRKRRRNKVPILRRIAREMRRSGEPLQARQMSDLELMTAYLESERAARTLLEALESATEGEELPGSLLPRLDTIGSAETLIDWGGIHLGTAARIEVMFELALRIAGVMPDDQSSN
jgi:hypothetical protein